MNKKKKNNYEFDEKINNSELSLHLKYFDDQSYSIFCVEFIRILHEI